MQSHTQKHDIVYSEAAVFWSNPWKQALSRSIQCVWISKQRRGGEDRKITNRWEALLSTERKAGWMRTEDFIWCCGRKEQEWWEAATTSHGWRRGSKAEHNMEIRSKITLWRLLEVGPIHFLIYIQLFPFHSPLFHLDKMSNIPGPSLMWFSALVLKVGKMWSNSHHCHWVCAFMLARNIDLCTETQSTHTHIYATNKIRKRLLKKESIPRAENKNDSRPWREKTLPSITDKISVKSVCTKYLHIYKTDWFKSSSQVSIVSCTHPYKSYWMHSSIWKKKNW